MPTPQTRLSDQTADEGRKAVWFQMSWSVKRSNTSSRFLQDQLGEIASHAALPDGESIRSLGFPWIDLGPGPWRPSSLRADPGSLGPWLEHGSVGLAEPTSPDPEQESTCLLDVPPAGLGQHWQGIEKCIPGAYTSPSPSSLTGCIRPKIPVTKDKDETRFERVTYRTAAGCSTPELFVLLTLKRQADFHLLTGGCVPPMFRGQHQQHAR